MSATELLSCILSKLTNTLCLVSSWHSTVDGIGAFFDYISPVVMSRLLKSLTTTEWMAESLNIGYKGRNYCSCDLLDYASLFRAATKFLDFG